jgi:hypothetical protein
LLPIFNDDFGIKKKSKSKEDLDTNNIEENFGEFNYDEEFANNSLFSD